MIDAPSPAAAAPAGRPRPPVASRPDERLALLEAIERRDAPCSRRLAERWVHRHGLLSLEAFERTSLQTGEGPEAWAWLRQLLQLPPSPPTAVPSAADLGPEIRLHDLIPGEPDLGPSLFAPAQTLPSVEEAFAALAAEFAGASAWAEPPAPAPQAPTRAELEAIAADGLDQVEAALLPSSLPPLSFAIGPAAALATPEPQAQETELLAAEAEAPVPEGEVAGPGTPWTDASPRPWHGRTLGRVSRVGSLLRTCFEEAISGFNPGGAPSPLAPEPANAAAEAPLAPGQVEPLAPLPAFHPTDSILASLPEVPSPAPAPPPQRWFPRLGFTGPSRRPAPAPADLADLRAWLPDGADDLPRAC